MEATRLAILVMSLFDRFTRSKELNIKLLREILRFECISSEMRKLFEDMLVEEVFYKLTGIERKRKDLEIIAKEYSALDGSLHFSVFRNAYKGGYLDVQNDRIHISLSDGARKLGCWVSKLASFFIWMVLVSGAVFVYLNFVHPYLVGQVEPPLDKLRVWSLSLMILSIFLALIMLLKLSKVRAAIEIDRLLKE